MSTISFKPRPVLQDMPYLVKNRILLKVLGSDSFTNCQERSLLRLVCQSFQKIIDSNWTTVELKIKFIDDTIIINRTTYRQRGRRCVEESHAQDDLSDTPFIRYQRDDYVEVALRHVEFFTSNPKFVFKLFRIELPDSIEDNRFVQRFLETLRVRQMHLKVKYFKLFYSKPEETVMKFLPFMNPAYFKTFFLRVYSTDPHSIEAMVDTDQWRNLEVLCLTSNPARQLAMEKWWDIGGLYMTLYHLKPSDLVGLLKHLMCSPTFKILNMFTRHSLRRIERQLRRNTNWSTIRVQNITFFVDRSAGKSLCLFGKADRSIDVRRTSDELLARAERAFEAGGGAQDVEDSDDDDDVED